MDRADLLTYLAVALAELLTECSIDTTDTAAGLQYPLDQTYEHIGSDTPADLAYMAVGEYYTLLRILNVLSGRVDFDATAHQNSKYSVLYNQVTARLELAAERAKAAGYPVSGETAVDTSNLDAPVLWLDFQEPYTQ